MGESREHWCSTLQPDPSLAALLAHTALYYRLEQVSSILFKRAPRSTILKTVSTKCLVQLCLCQNQEENNLWATAERKVGQNCQTSARNHQNQVCIELEAAEFKGSTVWCLLHHVGLMLKGDKLFAHSEQQCVWRWEDEIINPMNTVSTAKHGIGVCGAVLLPVELVL